VISRHALLAASFGSVTSAGTAESRDAPTYALNLVYVVCGLEVSLWADRDRVSCVTTSDVFLSSHLFEVFRVDTVRSFAEMVDRQCGIEFTKRGQVHRSMCKPTATNQVRAAPVEIAVAKSAGGADPVPTLAVWAVDDLCPVPRRQPPVTEIQLHGSLQSVKGLRIHP
jgi:hypothetical protein